VICPICVSPSLRGQLDSDVVRKLTLKELSHKYRLSSRVVLRHIRHLPELMEREASASKLSIYIGAVTYNINLIVSPLEEGAVVPDSEEAGTGHA
jgi:hypothetical protein